MANLSTQTRCRLFHAVDKATKTVLLLAFTLVAGGEAFAQPITRAEVAARIAQGEPARGGDKAPVTLMEFSDFQCGFCRKFWQATLPQLDKKYFQTARVRFVYRHAAILSQYSAAAAEASECAGEQGKFWPFHDKLFAAAGDPLAFRAARLKEYARDLGLKTAEFNRCLDAEKYSKKVEEQTALGTYLGVRGTPTFMLNGRLLVGAQPLDVFEQAIETELKAAAARKPARAP
jgi:protein-disulfide isomerase